MTRITFACRSNSCRSQMAEGWANEWINKERERLENALKIQTYYGSECVLDSPDYNNMDNKSTDVDDDIETLERKLIFLTNIKIFSVALDQNLFSDIDHGKKSNIKNTCMACDESECAVSQTRRSVKSKAIQAMAKDGVDISTHYPKSIVHILKVLGKQTVENFHISNEACSSSSSTDYKQNSRYHIFDKLIILCSCGDEMKQNLIQYSKSVEEWDIDPPTIAAKSGEGDQAYRRISLEIRCKVDKMFRNLTQNYIMQPFA